MDGTKSSKNQVKIRRRIYARTPLRWDCRAYIPRRIRREWAAQRDARVTRNEET